MSHSPHVEIYRSAEWDFRNADDANMDTRSMWRWRFRSSNGKILSESSEAYNDPRDLVRGLELSHPGHHMLDADRSLEGYGGWYLWPLWPGVADPISVRVPEGTVKLWRSRRNR